MASWILAIETNCVDPSREGEFNDWYDNTHLPDVLETPGILRGTRYENMSPDEEQGKYVALYEVDTEDMDQLLADLWEVTTKKGEEGRWSELVDTVSIRGYRQITSTMDSRTQP